MLALMGESGSGKSSLLAALGGRSALRRGGAVTVGGAPFTSESRRRVGFVHHEDVFYETLTVKVCGTHCSLMQ